MMSIEEKYNMRYDLKLFGHDDFEYTGIVITANSDGEAYSQVRWMYPHINKNAIELEKKID